MRLYISAVLIFLSLIALYGGLIPKLISSTMEFGYLAGWTLGLLAPVFYYSIVKVIVKRIKQSEVAK